METTINDILISDDKSRLQLDRICALLATTYWAQNRSRETIQTAIANSLCFGVYHNGEQIGFARCVTDGATVYWLADVIIDEHHRGKGIGKALIQAVVGHERLKNLTGILGTKDAHGLYEQYGFHRDDGRLMRRPV